MLRVHALVEHGGPLQVIERPMPLPKGEEVLVRTTSAGLCHSDLHQWEGSLDLGGGHKMPMNGARKDNPVCMGHEICGELLAVGPDVPAQFKPDAVARYAVYPWIGCGEPQRCVNCRGGNEHVCPFPDKQRDIGNAKDLRGGFASHIIVPSYKYLFKVPQNLPEEAAAIAMCSGLTAFSAVKKVDVLPKGPEDLLILGLGGLGFSGFQIAKHLYGAPPLCADVSEEAKALAAAEGAAVFDPRDPKVVEAIRNRTGGQIHCVIDFVGSEQSFGFGQKILRRGGKHIVVGLYGGSLVYPLPLFPIKGLSVVGSFTGSLSECQELFELLSSGKISPIKYHTRSITDAIQALDDLKNKRFVGRCVLKHDGGAQAKL